MVRPIVEGSPGRDSCGGRGTVVARAHMVCGECRYARLYSVQPRAVCTHEHSALRGRVVYSGRPACDEMRSRRGDDRTLAWCALREATTRLRFARVRPHLY